MDLLKILTSSGYKIMKMIEAIKRVDKNLVWPDLDEFCEEFGIESYKIQLGGYNKFETRVKAYHLTKWICTNTWVGHVVYFLDDEPVAISYQPARKSEKYYTFVSSESADKLRNFIISLLEEDETYVEILNFDDEIDEFYNVNFTGQLLTNEGYVDNRHCVIINNFKEDYISKRAVVKFDNGEEKEIDICDFKIRICIK